jgi:hypothetical protein
MLTVPKKPIRNSVRIALLFLISGITLFVLSGFLVNQIMSFIGLGLIFWGALFLLITPLKYVESTFLVTSTLPAYMTIDRMLKDLNPKNEAYNIPACPRNVDLPEHLKGLRETVTFIPAKDSSEMTEITEIEQGVEDKSLFENPKELLMCIARDKFLIENPKGLIITSPGIGLLDKIEQKRNKDSTKIPPTELDEILPSLLNELYLTKEIRMTTHENTITLQINDSLYKNLYSQKYNLKSINIIGCPIVNAVACAIAESTGKPTLIQKIETHHDGKIITATFKVVGGMFEEKPKSIWVDQKVDLRRTEMLDVLKVSFRFIELSFDILIGLQNKRINWVKLENYSKDFGPNLPFAYQTMPPLNLDFLKITTAINNQDLQKISKEAYNILKTIFEYFNSLNVDDDFKESVPNFQTAKIIISAYYAINDLLLGKIVGDIENKKESHQLESALENLGTNTSFRINIEELRVSIEKVTPETDLESGVDNVRGIFKEQLKQLSTLFNWFERTRQKGD